MKEISPNNMLVKNIKIGFMLRFFILSMYMNITHVVHEKKFRYQPDPNS